MKDFLTRSCLIIFLASCTSQVKNKLSDEIRQLKGNYSEEEVQIQYINEVRRSESLNRKQKNELLKLHVEIQDQKQEIDQKINKLKILSYMYLTAPKYNSDMINEIKNELNSNEKKKMYLYNKLEHHTRRILGRTFQDMNSSEREGNINYQR
jgi:uncharacterized membrane protein YhiD involved in acid resistance